MTRRLNDKDLTVSVSLYKSSPELRKTFKHAVQIYTYLMKLKLNMRKGPNRHCKKILYGYKK